MKYLLLSLIVFCLLGTFAILASLENEYIVEVAEAQEYVVGTITAYSADPEQTDERYWEMASGKTFYEGAIACPRVYPLGMLVEINGVEFRCEDRLNARYTDRWDIFVNSKAEALAFGIWREQIVIIK